MEAEPDHQRRLRYQVSSDDDDGTLQRPQEWQMVYGLTGAGSGKLGQGTSTTGTLMAPFHRSSVH